MYRIKICQSEQDIENCFPVLKQLHPELSHSEYLETTKRLMDSGYCLLALEADGAVKSVAGFHFGESFAWK